MRPRADSTYVGQGATLLVTDLSGVPRKREHGLWVDDTRMLSRYEWKIDDAELVCAGCTALEHDRWIGYFIQCPPNWRETPTKESNPAQETVELRITRSVSGSVHEHVEVTNHTQVPTRIRLSLEVDADFIDLKEATEPRQQHGRLSRRFSPGEGASGTLSLRYSAEHEYDHQGNRGVAKIDRALTLDVVSPGAAPRYEGGHLTFDVSLEPHGSWQVFSTWTPTAESSVLPTVAHLSGPAGGTGPRVLRNTWPQGATEVRAEGDDDSLAHLVNAVLRQAQRDLAALRMLGHEGRSELPVFVGGWPTYTAFFGRDSLFASWQCGMLSTDLMRGALQALAASQANETNAWRDEAPGRMLHEHHNGPLSSLRYGPHGAYYGDVTSSFFYPEVVSALWHWTGDLELVRPFVPPSLRALEWADSECRRGAFYQYESRSEQGEKNQGWKDSNDAIVYPDGSQVSAPIGTCEMQGIVFASKVAMSELLLWMGDEQRARRMYEEANALKRRFNDVFWMEDEKFVALALDAQQMPVRSIASDAGHCVASGIVDDARVPAVAARLMSPELFSGWGVRTLSSRHPAYNPFAYHRGTVWPVENAMCVLGLAHYGLEREMHTLCKSQFEAASLFDSCRLPETFGGHPRDEAHPVPGLYPRADWPQAWSASAVFAMIQSMLGITPFAPMRALLLDPHLPEWLPRITLTHLRVGGATVDLRFVRREDGHTTHEVLRKEGELQVVQHPAAHRLCTGWGEAVRDTVRKLLPAH